MQLLLIRHAIAEEREDFARTGKDDRLRPLTDEGRKKMRQAAKGLRGVVPEIDLLATSPLTRAAQTAAVLDTVYGGLKEVEIEELSPQATPKEFLRWLRKQKADTLAAVVKFAGGRHPNGAPGRSGRSAWCSSSPRSTSISPSSRTSAISLL
jgi:phosphohistidine phosphatase SixA